jgi:broad specificity phosphatase PhoE
LLQAAALARRLSNRRVGTVYSSDLGRALRTAEIIATACGVPLRVDRRLRERNMGIFQGLTLKEIRDRYPQECAAFEQSGFEYIIPEGESGRQRLDRSVRVLTEIAEQHSAEQIVAVTHGGILMGFFEHVLGMNPGNGWRFQRHHTSFNAFEYADGRWRLETWNDVGHVDSLDDPLLRQSQVE